MKYILKESQVEFSNKLNEEENKNIGTEINRGQGIYFAKLLIYLH